MRRRNFGIVTAFTYTCMPSARSCRSPSPSHSAERFGDALVELQESTANAPDDVGVNIAMITAPPLPMTPVHLHGQRVAAVVACWSGVPDAAERALRPALQAGTPEVVELTAMPYVRCRRWSTRPSRAVWAAT